MSELSGDSGEIVSPLFPTAYFHDPAHDRPSWRITVDEGTKIHIQMLIFELEMDQYSNAHGCLSEVIVSAPSFM